ncbi:MAG: metal-sensitive transcriptional regulator [Thermotogota bacterium]|nr:metal-sensitive transcriptional regulator [Thermotogota bacterium]
MSTEMNKKDRTAYDKMIMTRLKKIEGQIRGIQRMIEAGRNCSDILIQMSAVKFALKKTNYLILKQYANTCLQDLSNTGESKMEDFLITMNEILFEIDDETDNTNGGADNEKNT